MLLVDRGRDAPKLEELVFSDLLGECDVVEVVEVVDGRTESVVVLVVFAVLF